MKVLAINGSHRKGKNTAHLLAVVLEAVRTCGAETELIDLLDYHIKPCLACNRCLKITTCSIKDDDMSIIAGKMLAADAIILGSPVYFGNVTGLMKNFMDRTRWLHMCKNLLYGKVGAAVTIAGLRNGGQEFTQIIMERFLAGHGLIVVESRDHEEKIYNYGPMGTLFKGLEGEKMVWKNNVGEDFLTIQECHRLGRNIIKQLMPNKGITFR